MLSSPRKRIGAKLRNVSRAQRGTSHKRVYARLRRAMAKWCAADTDLGFTRDRHFKCAQVGHARLAWTVTVRRGPGSAAHRSTSFRAAPHPGHLASLALMRVRGDDGGCAIPAQSAGLRHALPNCLRNSSLARIKVLLRDAGRLLPARLI